MSKSMCTETVYFGSKSVTTRTPHKCFGCDKTFSAGTRMERTTTKDDGEIFSAYFCPVCTAFLHENQDVATDGFCAGELPDVPGYAEFATRAEARS